MHVCAPFDVGGCLPTRHNIEAVNKTMPAGFPLPLRYKHKTRRIASWMAYGCAAAVAACLKAPKGLCPPECVLIATHCDRARARSCMGSTTLPTQRNLVRGRIVASHA